MLRAADAKHLLRTWANDAAAFAEVLSLRDPCWKSETFPLSGGRVVLCGRGMYVNRALAVGLDDTVDDDAWRHFEERCAVLGVAPAFEMTPFTSAAMVAALEQREYVKQSATAALARRLDALPTPDASAAAWSIEPVSDELLPAWQATAAAGWGHVEPPARRVSDAFAATAYEMDGDEMILARDTASGVPIGCASLTISGPIATLGGMSTVPSHRGRGVQTAMIRYRLSRAIELGCTLAVSTASPDGGSERNLIRGGFERCFLIEQHGRGVEDTA